MRTSITQRFARTNSILLMLFFTLVVAITVLFEAQRSSNVKRKQLQLTADNYIELIANDYQTLFSEVEKLSKNSLLINSLIDINSSQAYLSHTLNELVRYTKVAEAVVFNYSGEITSKTSANDPDWVNASLMRTVIAAEKALVRFIEGEFYLALPIMYADVPQGGVAVRIPASEVLPEKLLTSSYDYKFFINQSWYWQPRDFTGNDEQVTSSIKVFPNGGNFDSRLVLSYPAGEGSNLGADWLTNLVIISLIALPLIHLIAKRVSHSMATPILRLSERISSNQYPVSPLGTEDELELVAQAFDKVAKRLMETNDALEQRVKERTQELKAQAAQLSAANLELKQLDEMKNQFISTVSHELRTPLTSIHGALSILNSEAVQSNPDKVKQLIGLAQNNSERLSSLINDLLDFQKLAVGKVDLFIEPKDIKQLVVECCEGTKGYQEKYGVKLEIDASNAIDHYVADIDAHRVRQVLDNLASNAIKYSNKGDVVKVSIIGDTNALVIRVRDYGSGVPEQYREKLFLPFTQADSSDTRTHDGTGLGLSISKKFIEAHGGEIGYIPAEPGSIFWILLPVKQPQNNEADSAVSAVTLS